MTKIPEFPRYLVTASNAREYTRKGGEFVFSVFHIGHEQPISPGIYKTLCGITVDIAGDAEELGTSPEGSGNRCCLKCLKVMNE